MMRNSMRDTMMFRTKFGSLLERPRARWAMPLVAFLLLVAGLTSPRQAEAIRCRPQVDLAAEGEEARLSDLLNDDTLLNELAEKYSKNEELFKADIKLFAERQGIQLDTAGTFETEAAERLWRSPENIIEAQGLDAALTEIMEIRVPYLRYLPTSIVAARTVPLGMRGALYAQNSLLFTRGLPGAVSRSVMVGGQLLRGVSQAGRMAVQGIRTAAQMGLMSSNLAARIGGMIAMTALKAGSSLFSALASPVGQAVAIGVTLGLTIIETAEESDPEVQALMWADVLLETALLVPGLLNRLLNCGGMASHTKMSKILWTNETHIPNTRKSIDGWIAMLNGEEYSTDYLLKDDWPANHDNQRCYKQNKDTKEDWKSTKAFHERRMEDPSPLPGNVLLMQEYHNKYKSLPYAKAPTSACSFISSGYEHRIARLEYRANQEHCYRLSLPWLYPYAAQNFNHHWVTFPQASQRASKELQAAAQTSPHYFGSVKGWSEAATKTFNNWASMLRTDIENHKEESLVSIYELVLRRKADIREKLSRIFGKELFRSYEPLRNMRDILSYLLTRGSIDTVNPLAENHGLSYSAEQELYRLIGPDSKGNRLTACMSSTSQAGEHFAVRGRLCVEQLVDRWRERLLEDYRSASTKREESPLLKLVDAYRRAYIKMIADLEKQAKTIGGRYVDTLVDKADSFCGDTTREMSSKLLSVENTDKLKKAFRHDRSRELGFDMEGYSLSKSLSSYCQIYAVDRAPTPTALRVIDFYGQMNRFFKTMKLRNAIYEFNHKFVTLEAEKKASKHSRELQRHSSEFRDHNDPSLRPLIPLLGQASRIVVNIHRRSIQGKGPKLGDMKRHAAAVVAAGLPHFGDPQREDSRHCDQEFLRRLDYVAFRFSAEELKAIKEVDCYKYTVNALEKDLLGKAATGYPTSPSQRDPRYLPTSPAPEKEVEKFRHVQGVLKRLGYSAKNAGTWTERKLPYHSSRKELDIYGVTLHAKLKEALTQPFTRETYDLLVKVNNAGRWVQRDEEGQAIHKGIGQGVNFWNWKGWDLTEALKKGILPWKTKCKKFVWQEGKEPMIEATLAPIRNGFQLLQQECIQKTKSGVNADAIKKEEEQLVQALWSPYDRKEMILDLFGVAWHEVVKSDKRRQEERIRAFRKYLQLKILAEKNLKGDKAASSKKVETPGKVKTDLVKGKEGVRSE